MHKRIMLKSQLRLVSAQYWKKFATIFCKISTGERPFVDILQDRRYWVIHSLTIPSLFLSGVIFCVSGFVYKLFGVPNLNQYFFKDSTELSIINDRFSALSEIEDI